MYRYSISIYVYHHYVVEGLFLEGTYRGIKKKYVILSPYPPLWICNKKHGIMLSVNSGKMAAFAVAVSCFFTLKHDAFKCTSKRCIENSPWQHFVRSKATRAKQSALSIKSCSTSHRSIQNLRGCLRIVLSPARLPIIVFNTCMVVCVSFVKGLVLKQFCYT
jgi:hypothetical protein